MFHLDQRYRTQRILSIDPGLNNLGLAYCTVDTNWEIQTLRTETIVTEKLPDLVPYEEDMIGSRVYKLMNLKQHLRERIAEFQPGFVVAESPFFNPTKPMAFSALVEVMLIIRVVLLEYNAQVALDKIEPKAVKKTVGVAGVSGKDAVRVAVQKTEALMKFFPDGIDHLSEHEVDALIVLLTYINRLKEQTQ